MANNSSGNDFNSLFFEKKLTLLKDSQESINNCCKWCLENRQHHKKIVNAWLNVLKRVKVEHRLTLFYLANDVIQYSKKKNYEFVESWGTSLQKATTLVRDEKVKHKILRIFKIWEQRGIYGEEFIGDLSGLISASPPARKSEEPHEFESQYLITKIRNCAKLENETDEKLKKYKEHNPKILEGDSMFSSLKDRAHVDDVEKEMEEYDKHLEGYLNALKNEIKARNHLIHLLVQAENQLDKDKKDVKLVANAYRAFAARVKNLKKKLDELKPTLSSPIPSPDINAPSPSPDSDDDMQEPAAATTPKNPTVDYTSLFNPGFYNPVHPPTTTENSNDFLSNGFSSFMGGNMPFNLQNLFNNSTTAAATGTTTSFNTGNMFATGVPPPLPVNTTNNTEYQYNNSSLPLMPPPIPPFSKSETGYGTGTSTYTESYTTGTVTTYGNRTFDQNNVSNFPTAIPPPYQPTPSTNYQSPETYPATPAAYPVPAPAYETAPPAFLRPDGDFSTSSLNFPPPTTTNSFAGGEEYNPEEEPETWDNEVSWDAPPPIETPESPPLFEKEGFSDPVEYHDMPQHGTGVDMDHRVLPVLPDIPVLDSDIIGHRKKDVDHRNLISLTGSPKETSKKWTSGGDKDYRKPQKSGPGGADQDYRSAFTLDSLKLPPPPPPPNQVSPIKSINLSKKTQSPRKLQDKVEIIDMDLSDDEVIETTPVNDNLTVVPIVEDVSKTKQLEPPPPLPDLPEDVDANNLLDDLEKDLSSNEFLEQEDMDSMDGSFMNQRPPAFPPGFNNQLNWNNGLSIPPNDLINPALLEMPNMLEVSGGVIPGGFPMGMSPMNNFPFRGRGGRGNFNISPMRGQGDYRGRGRANWSPFRGGNNRGSPNFRGNWTPPRGGPMRGNINRGRPFFRGNGFRGAF